MNKPQTTSILFAQIPDIEDQIRQHTDAYQELLILGMEMAKLLSHQPKAQPLLCRWVALVRELI